MLVAREAQVYRQIQENKSLFASGDMQKEKVFGLGLKEIREIWMYRNR